MTKGLFVTATGTEIGKTYATALVVKKLREARLNAGYYKAALSDALEEKDGRLIPGDADFVCRTAGIAGDPSELVSFIYKTPVSPHLAAEIEGRPIEFEKIRRDFLEAAERFDYLTCEGSGGIVCPLRLDTQKIMLTDVIKMTGLGILIIADAGLGTLNATALTIEYARGLGIPIRGVVLNHFEKGNAMHEDNLARLEGLTGVPVVFCISESETSLDAVPLETLRALYTEIDEGAAEKWTL